MDTTFEKIYSYSGKCAAKLVDGFHHMSYLERLKKLNLPSLVYRKDRGKRFSNISTPMTTVRYLKTSDLETVLVENATTNWYGKHPKMA